MMMYMLETVCIVWDCFWHCVTDGLWEETVCLVVLVLCSANQRGEVGAGCVQGVMGLQWCFRTCVSPEWRPGWHDFVLQSGPSVVVCSCPAWWLIQTRCDGCAESRLDYCRVEVDQQLLDGLYILCWAFFLIVPMLDALFRSWEIVDPRNLKVFNSRHSAV